MSQRDEAVSVLGRLYAKDMSSGHPPSIGEIVDALAAAGLLVPPEPDDDFELPDDLDMVKPFVQMKRERDEARRRAVPPGLTAENLRRAALMVENGTYRREIADRLTSWASFLDTQETPR